MTKTILILILAVAAIPFAGAAEARRGVVASSVHAPSIIIRVDRPPYDERGMPLA